MALDITNLLDEEYLRKIRAAKEAIRRHEEIIPGGIKVFSQMVFTSFMKGENYALGTAQAVFAILPEEDLQHVVEAFQSVSNKRTQILSQKT